MSRNGKWKREAFLELWRCTERTLPYHDVITIHIGEGEKTERPVVKLNIAINGKKYSDVPFSISDRSENEYKILLGEKFIKANGGMVDVTKKD